MEKKIHKKNIQLRIKPATIHTKIQDFSLSYKNLRQKNLILKAKFPNIPITLLNFPKLISKNLYAGLDLIFNIFFQKGSENVLSWVICRKSYMHIKR